MMEIQNNILEKLHCIKCNEYLSYAPIMVTENGASLCGRCVDDNSDIKLIRNQAYEDFAAGSLFPCRYNGSGCEGTIPWNDVIDHEDNCEYTSTECPVMPEGTCKWQGPQCTLLDHYKETHPDLILEHPCSLDTNIVVVNDKNMLLSFLGFVFLVQIRCNTALSKLWHSVYCFEQPKITRQLNFCVKFSSDEGSFKMKKPVLSAKCLKMQTDNCMETNVSNLLGLLGDCKNIKVILSILPKADSDLLNLFLCSKCKKSKLPAVYRNNEEYYCSDCKQEDSFLDRDKNYLYNKVLKQCKNNNAGCPYINFNNKLICRHEIFECKWQKKCFFNCSLNSDELQNHYSKAHESVLCKWLKPETWYCELIRKDDIIIFCKFFMANTYFKAYIYTQLPLEDINLYNCKIEPNKSDDFTLKCSPTAKHDWEINKLFLGSNPYLDKDNEYKILNIFLSKK